jgi:hypothetical protein
LFGTPTSLARNSAAESEGGQKFLPPNPLPFCPPERSVLVLPPVGRQSVGILFKMSSDFFQQTPPDRKLQARGSRLASLGDQIVRNFGRKNQLAILQNAVRADIFIMNFIL